MKYDDMLNFVLKLPFDTMTEVYNNSEQSILIFRPSTLPKRFKDYDDARQRISEFVQFYNESRPHGSIGYKVPSQAHQETGIQRCMWR